MHIIHRAVVVMGRAYSGADGEGFDNYEAEVEDCSSGEQGVRSIRRRLHHHGSGTASRWQQRAAEVALDHVRLPSTRKNVCEAAASFDGTLDAHTCQ